MPKTFVDGREVQRWWVDGRQVKKAYLDGRLIYQLGYTLNITASNHNVGVDWVWGLLPSWVRDDQTIPVSVVVHGGVELVSSHPRDIAGVFHFRGGWGSRAVTITNYGYILGRGGQGGGWEVSYPDQNTSLPGGTKLMYGGRAILNETSAVTIFNHGVIGGGGGGGGSSLWEGYHGAVKHAGGGGAPFGNGGTGNDSVRAGNGSFTGGGAGATWGEGAGGGWGSKGGDSAHVPNKGWYGGAAGEATRGAINWAVLGDVRGSRV